MEFYTSVTKLQKFWCEHLNFLYENYWFYISKTHWFIKCSEKHINSRIPLCIVLYNPLQEQNHIANCNVAEQTHVKGRWLSCSFDFGLSEFLIYPNSVYFCYNRLIELCPTIIFCMGYFRCDLHSWSLCTLQGWLYQEASSTLIF